MADEKRGIKVKSSIPKKLAGRNVSTYGEKLKELSSVAGEIAPEGTLVVALFERGESFSPTTKVIKDLLDLESFYSHKSIQMNPKLAIEYAEIAEAMKVIERVVGKRRKTMFANKDAKKQPKGE